MPRTTDKKPVYSFDVDLPTLNDISVFLGHGPLPIRGYEEIQQTDATTRPGALGNILTRIGAPRYAQRELSREPYISRIVRLSVPQQPDLADGSTTLYSKQRRSTPKPEKVKTSEQLPFPI